MIRQHCKTLRTTTIGGQFSRAWPGAATREGQTHIDYLEALLAAKMDGRESRAISRLLHEARLPWMKTLDELEFDRSEGLTYDEMLNLSSLTMLLGS